MNARLILAAGVTAGLVLSVTGANATTVVLDGKKTKTISFTAVAAAQENDAKAFSGDLSGVDRTTCTSPQCAYVDFTYKPAKGVKAVGLAFQSSWTTPVGADIDLYIAVLDKYGDPSQLATCGAAFGTHERIYLPASTFKTGKKYRMIAYFARAVNETVTTSVTFNGANTVPTTVPTGVDGQAVWVNCGL